MATGVQTEKREPKIKMNHVDGPMLNTTIGSFVWLSYWDRFLLYFGLTDINKLNLKYTSKNKVKTC